MGTRRTILNTVLLLVFYSVGTMGIFTSYYCSHHKLSFQASVKATGDADLQSIFFTRQEYQSIQWTESETEFEWQGKMYDVSKIYEKGEGYVIVCENDSLEEMLMALFNSASPGKEGQGSQKGNPQPQFLSPLYKVDPFACCPRETNQYSSVESLYHSIKLEITLPPPRPTV